MSSFLNIDTDGRLRSKINDKPDDFKSILSISYFAVTYALSHRMVFTYFNWYVRHVHVNYILTSYTRVCCLVSNDLALLQLFLSSFFMHIINQLFHLNKIYSLRLLYGHNWFVHTHFLFLKKKRHGFKIQIMTPLQTKLFNFNIRVMERKHHYKLNPNFKFLNVPSIKQIYSIFGNLPVIIMIK